MSKKFIFKYQDQVDANVAFVISTTEEKARIKLSMTTTIPLLLMCSKSIEDIPAIQEKFNYIETEDGEDTFIYKSNILPF